jgi:hypothetical protein
MLLYILKFSFISLILIILVHYLYLYFTSLLTTPKIKDLVMIPNKKYEELYELIKTDDTPKQEISETTNIDMKNELKEYLNNKINNMQPTSQGQLLYSDIKHT